MSKHTLAICGFGWLAQHFYQRYTNEYQFIGTTRSEEKARTNSNHNLRLYPFSLGDSPASWLKDTAGATLLLNIPPGRKAGPAERFEPEMKALIQAAKNADIKHIVFISTTSVYGDEVQGEVTEHTPTAPTTGSGKVHVAIEEYLASQSVPYTVVRLAGLIGPDRHPINTLAGRTLQNGQQATNLIHIEDVCRALHQVIKQSVLEQTLVLCSQAHPQRGAYYTYCAEKLGLEPPHFEGYQDNLPTSGKQINSAESFAKLGLEMCYPSPYDML